MSILFSPKILFLFLHLPQLIKSHGTGRRHIQRVHSVGHADVSMTQHYLHVQESIRQDAIDRFSKAFPTGHSGPENPPPVCKVLKFPNVG